MTYLTWVWHRLPEIAIILQLLTTVLDLVLITAIHRRGGGSRSQK